MIGKTKGGLGRYKRHMTVNAIAAAFCKALGLLQFGGTRVALQTFVVEECYGFRNSGFVGIVASKAREGAAAFQETETLAEVDRLVANVPSVVPIHGGAGGRGRTMASAAKAIQLRRR